MSSLRRAMVRLTIPQWDFLRREARRIGVNPAELLRRILDDYRERREPQVGAAAEVATEFPEGPPP